MTIAICTYNGAPRLEKLVEALRNQDAGVRFEILIVDNKSTDNTARIAENLIERGEIPVRYVRETAQGISYARNRAIREAEGEYLAFIDDDEIPGKLWLSAALSALNEEGADCVGGKIRVIFPPCGRPSWLSQSVLGFLGHINYGDDSFWIVNENTPIYSGNIAYRTSVFSNGRLFDLRYNREKKALDGGEDRIMFQQLLREGFRLRYRPDMVVEHFVSSENLRISYFFRLHFRAGFKYALYEMNSFGREVMGIPPFLFVQMLRQARLTLSMLVKRHPESLRQAMTLSYAMGSVWGRLHRK